MVKAVIFDMDGVLVDSEAFYLYFYQDFFERHGQRITRKELLETAGMGMSNFWEWVGHHWNPNISGPEAKQIADEDTDPLPFHYKDMKMPHLDFMLRSLKEHDIKLAIGSSSYMENIQRMMDELKIADYFDVVCSGHDFKESKPNPEIYLETMKRLRVTAEETVVIEDSIYGIEAGKNAGCKVIAREDNRFHMDQSMADYIACDLLDAYSKIMEWNQ